jgi:hypothetical protein
VDSETRELIEDLLDYFEMGSGEWPMLNVQTADGMVSGVVDDRLYATLVALDEQLELIDDKDI